MKVRTILDNIDLGDISLPEFQRGYVWSRDQVRRFMTSMYRGWPVGSLMEWNPPVGNVAVRGGHQKEAGTIRLLIDGQQRITTLYGIARGKPPRFFNGNAGSFLDLYFHLDTEEFEFYGPVKMKRDPRWIKVTALLQTDAGTVLQQLRAAGAEGDFTTDLNRLNDLERIFDREFHIDTISGLEHDIGVVVEIFNAVNSGGTKLSEADLLLAKISAQRPTARTEMQQRLRRWDEQAGYSFDLNWMLRGIIATLRGRAELRHVRETPGPDEFGTGLQRFEKHVDELLLQIRAHLGLDHDSVLRSHNAFPLLARYLELNAGFRQGEGEIARLLYWYIHCFLWGRYSGSTESTMERDLNILSAAKSPRAQVDGLIGELRSERGTLELSPQDFHGSWSNNRLYPLLYLLTRVGRARDFCKNIPLSMDLPGNPLEKHHLFPKSLLYRAGRSRRDVHSLANFAFLTRDCNRAISNRAPADYFADCERRHPGVLASQWIPLDERLWQLEHYDEFLAYRRERLAEAANQLLDRLAQGVLPQPGQPLAPATTPVTGPRPVHITSDDEERALLACQDWMRRQGLPPGEPGHELVDGATGNLLATLDLAWPTGVQPGLSQPVALLLDEKDGTRYLNGLVCYTSLADFQRHVRQEILAEPEGAPATS